MPLLFNPSHADENGLVAIGGDLEPATLVRAYRSGVFPWFNEGDPYLWWSPDPRAVFDLDTYHVSRRLARTLRAGKWRVTFDLAFRDVMTLCAERPDGLTWITADMIDAYERLHHLGVAHSVEAWHGDLLGGGLYGIAIGGFFSGESMFTRVTDGSKIALAFLVQHLRQQGHILFDTQMVTPHTASLGALEIPRSDYLRRLRRALALPVAFA